MLGSIFASVFTFLLIALPVCMVAFIVVFPLWEAVSELIEDLKEKGYLVEYSFSSVYDQVKQRAEQDRLNKEYAANFKYSWEK